LADTAQLAPTTTDSTDALAVSAEERTPAQHGAKAHSDGGWDAREKGFVPVQTRDARFRSYAATEFPEVTGQEVNWKLTPVARMRDLIDGELAGAPYAFESPTVDGIDVSWIDRADARIGSVGIPEDKAAANAWGSFEKALAITISGEEQHELVLRRGAFGSSPLAAHTIIEAKPFSRAVIVLDNSGPASLVENVEIIVGASARVTIVTVQDFDGDARYVSTHFGSVGRDAHLKHVVVSLGGSLVRVNPAITLAEPGADGELLGIYFSDEGQHLEQQVFLFHKAAHTKGRVNYKGALQGAGARSVWIGDVLIGPHASSTDSYEQNRNLVLTDGTRADSIPNLEIETGDILGAGHASATGRFDDEQLFYLCSRGIPETEARRLVVRGFLAEVVQKIGFPPLEERLNLAIEVELEASVGVSSGAAGATGAGSTGAAR